MIAVTHSMQSIRLCDRLLLLATGGRPAYFGRPQLAPACFGCDDLLEVFQLLNADRDRDWSAQLRADPQSARPQRANGDGARPDNAAPERPRRVRMRSLTLRHVKTAAQRWSSHFALLVGRYVRVIAGDRRNAILLVLAPVVLGLLMMAALPAGEFASPAAGHVRAVPRAGLVLLVVLLGATWLGA